MPSNARGLGNELAHIAAVGIENFFFADKHGPEFEAIGLPERLIKNAARHFKTDEIVIAVRGVALPRNLENVEAEFRLDMGEPGVFVSNAVAIFLAQPGIEERHSTIDANAMAVVVRRIVRQRTEGEGILSDVLRIP